jgi:hypothetical protein
MASRKRFCVFIAAVFMSVMLLFAYRHTVEISTPNGFAQDRSADSGRISPRPAKPLPKVGEQCWVGPEYYFVHGFDKRPTLGVIILKIQVFRKDGTQVSFFEITGNSGMPSMRGAHDSGDQPFKQNKRGDYLLPLNVVMPGEWEVSVTVLDDKKPIFSGYLRFHV